MPWLDPKQGLRAQLIAAHGLAAGNTMYHNISARNENEHVVYASVHGDTIHYVRPETAIAVAKLLDRFGWGFWYDRLTSALLPKRKAPLLNENVVINRQNIKMQYQKAIQEMQRITPLWEATKSVRAVLLDKRMVQGLVNMARGWPEVMHIAYDGETFTSFEGHKIKAEENAIAIRFWPVCFQQDYGTIGLTGTVTWHIESSGSVRWSNDSGWMCHPHLFSDGTFCPGTAANDFSSQIQSLATLRDWWVGTDHHPATRDWADQARQWWDQFGSAFFDFWDGGKLMTYVDHYKAYDNEFRAQDFYVEHNVSDDGLDIPGLSLPEYTLNRGGAYYIVAPEQSSGSDLHDGDEVSVASIFRLTADVRRQLLETYNEQGRDQRFDCAICGAQQHENDAYYCDYCDHYICDRHYNPRHEICDTCYYERYTACTGCRREITYDDAVRCHACGSELCSNCAFYCDDDDQYYCESDFPDSEEEETDDEDDRTPLPGQAPLTFTQPDEYIVCRNDYILWNGDAFCTDPSHTVQTIATRQLGTNPLAAAAPLYICADHYLALPITNIRCEAHGNVVCRLCADSEDNIHEWFHRIQPLVNHPECMWRGCGDEALWTDAGPPHYGYQYRCGFHVPRINGNAEEVRRQIMIEQPMDIIAAYYWTHLASGWQAPAATTLPQGWTYVPAGHEVTDLPNFEEMESEAFWPMRMHNAQAETNLAAWAGFHEAPDLRAAEQFMHEIEALNEPYTWREQDWEFARFVTFGDIISHTEDRAIAPGNPAAIILAPIQPAAVDEGAN